MAKAKKKPAKKSAKKPAAKKAAKQATANKATPKKATAKKAAPKKPAAKKPAAKQPAAKKPPKEPTTTASSGLRDEILAMARTIYGNRGDAELLALDPNDIDEMDPSIFYELLTEKYGVQADPDNDYFGGFGGTIEKTIAFVESKWNGQTRRAPPTPPSDWLETYVHPATDEAVAEE